MNTSPNLIFAIPPEIWQNHICIELSELTSLRLTCSFFRKKILYSPPYWEQWIPFDQLTKSEEIYEKLGWHSEGVDIIYGIYFRSIRNSCNEEIKLSKESFAALPYDLQAVDFSVFYIESIYIKDIQYLPATLTQICLKFSLHTEPKEYQLLTQIYETFPSILIYFKRYDGGVYSILYNACIKGYKTIVEYLLDNHKNEAKECIKHENLIIECCKSLGRNLTQTGHNYLTIIYLLLKNGASPNVSSDDSKTPLMYACIYSNIVLVKLLLEYGADKNKTDKHGGTVIGYIKNRMPPFKFDSDNIILSLLQE